MGDARVSFAHPTEYHLRYHLIVGSLGLPQGSLLGTLGPQGLPVQWLGFRTHAKSRYSVFSLARRASRDNDNDNERTASQSRTWEKKI